MTARTISGILRRAARYMHAHPDRTLSSASFAIAPRKWPPAPIVAAALAHWRSLYAVPTGDGFWRMGDHARQRYVRSDDVMILSLLFAAEASKR